MPVILRGEQANAWIDADVDEPKTLAGLLRPFPADEMVCYEVGSAVRSAKINSAACVESLEPRNSE